MKPFDLSICIVTYKARDLLRDCLSSVASSTSSANYEIIVLDNGSYDGVAEMLQQEFPSVYFIQNNTNDGYTKPMNQALQAGRGRYLVQLNPDTVILPSAFERLLEFMDSHPEVGICGPKVLNADGTLQKPCRRGESRPWAVISYFSGLSAMFPKSRLFGGYLLNYMDEDETHEVAGVSGSCMLIRREVVDQIGYLDERFYAYQEDADYCFQAIKAGWKVYYVPAAQIIHYGGQGGSRVEPYRSILAWHRSYWLYYRKNFASDYFFMFNWIYYLLIGFKLVYSLLVNSIRKEKFAGPKRKLPAT
jgi:GT2 family glycosyltransferase